jgi:hypothetical protein
MGGILVPVRRFVADPEIDEVAGAIELPLTGFITKIRMDTVRLIGYVSRGIGAEATHDTTLILHLPRTGFSHSLSGALWHWENDAFGKRVH